jgi:uncharacterized protein YndB with AHSA1/START domain
LHITTNTDRIEKQVLVKAPPKRVWRALTHSAEFGDWFRVKLTEVPDGTLLKVTESGFDNVPLERRDTAYRGNSEGWGIQMGNIERYVSQHP